MVNTAGQGAVMRREPSVNATTVGIIPEGAIVQLAGAEETVQAQTWWLAALLAAAQRIEPAAEASSNSP